MGWLSGWKYRKSHKIQGSTAGAVTDYQVRIKVHYGSGTDSGEDVYLNGKCRTDFGDIRFTKDDGETLLDYWIEEKVDSDYAIFWVKVPNIPASPNTATIYIYYENSSATSTSNGENTFEFFDDFEDEIIDTDKWEEWQTGDFDNYVTEENGYLQVDGNTEDWNDHGAKAKNIGLDTDKVWMFRAGKFGSGWGDCDLVWSEVAAEHREWAGAWLGYYDGGWNSLANVNEGSWKRYEVICKSSTEFTVKRDGETYSYTRSALSLPIDVLLGGTIHSNPIARYDWVACRKYVDPEPSHGSWGREEHITILPSRIPVRIPARYP